MVFSSLFVKELSEEWFLVDNSSNKVMVMYNRDVHRPRLMEGWWDLREIFKKSQEINMSSSGLLFYFFFQNILYSFLVLLHLTICHFFSLGT